MNQTDMENIYRNKSPEDIPWNIEAPPEALVALVEGGIVQPCKALDLGCGTGNYAIYLAGKGFEATGVDVSPTAIGIARENARKKGVKCDFFAADVLDGLKGLKGDFDFAYDWALLHHLFPEKRKQYVENVHGKLNPKGRYLSLCFSEDDPQFGGSGKYRETPLGTTLYFSSEDELRALFPPYFSIEELKTIEVVGKFGPHRAIYAFMHKE